MKRLLVFLITALFTVRNFFLLRLHFHSKTRINTVDRFHKLFYFFSKRTWENTHWLGIPLLKCPLDLWIYQEIVFELKPDLIVECGTGYGGTTLFLASVLDLIKKGRIITIDIQNIKKPPHKRIIYLVGCSTSETITKKVKQSVKPKDKVLVILDSNHSKNHVLNEINFYSQLVTKGSYLIVEDTNINGHPVLPNFGQGPMEAVHEFLKLNKNFKVDRKREKYFLSFNINGYLRKVA